MQNLTSLATSVKDNLQSCRVAIGAVLEKGPITTFSPIYNAMYNNGLNNSSALLSNLISGAEQADKNREDAQKLLAVGLQEVENPQSPPGKDWKAFATKLIADLVNIFPLNKETAPAA